MNRYREQDKIESCVARIEILANKIYDKLDELADKSEQKPKQLLWTQWNSSSSQIPPYPYVDLMLADGEIIDKFRASEMVWCTDMPQNKRIIAWRESV